jgi:hypothetical protein
VFAKIPRGGLGFQEKLPRESPYFGFYFYCIFINKCFEICLGTGVLYLPSPFPLTPFVCITENVLRLIMYNWSNVSFNYFVLNFTPANDCCSFKTKEQRSCFTFGEIIFPNKSIISLFNATTPNHFLLLLWQALVGHFQLFWFCF